MLTDTILRNRYKILKELGRGGFSVTYLAVDMDLPGNPKCVVKQLKTRHSNNTILQIAKKLFNREAQVLYRLGKGHKQIPEMFAHFEENDEFYLVQEFVDGHDLTKEIKARHRLSEDKVIKLLQEILEVLSFVHENNVIHRDIKLRNIMRRREDGKIVLIDFGAVKEIKGLAKNEQGDVNSTLIIGTPGYMPDEQANGKPRLCSDVYAVGMLGIQALTGIPPRELPFNPNNGELIWREKAKVSDRLAEILTSMVRHHFSQRYQTAAEALQALKSPVALKPNTSLAYEVPPVTLPSTVRPSHPVALQTLGLVGLMGIGFGLGVFGWNFFQSGSVGNEPLRTTEIPATTQKINPSVKPDDIKLSPPPTFSPSATRKDGGTNYPVLRPFPFPSFFKDVNRSSASQESSQSKDKSNKSQPVREKPQPKTSVAKEEKVKQEKATPSTYINPEIKDKQESLPSIAIPPSQGKKVEDSPTSLTPNPTPTPKPQKEEPSSSNSNGQQQDKKEDNKDNLEPKTPLPNKSDSVGEENDHQKDNSEPETSKPEISDSVDEKEENPPASEQSDKDKNEPQAEQPLSDPISPDTPAIESELPPQPTPSPLQTSDSSVVVPTAQPLLEDNNFFYTVPTSPTLVPEAEAQPTLSPQPTQTPKSQSQSAATPQPTQTPEPEAQPALSPQPTQTPEPEAQPTPQASAKPEPESEPIPQSELLMIPEVYASPSAETEIQITPPQTSASPSESENFAVPQASASPSPHSQMKLAPTPSPTQEPDFSLKRFAILLGKDKLITSKSEV